MTGDSVTESSCVVIPFIPFHLRFLLVIRQLIWEVQELCWHCHQGYLCYRAQMRSGVLVRVYTATMTGLYVSAPGDSSVVEGWACNHENLGLNPGHDRPPL